MKNDSRMQAEKLISQNSSLIYSRIPAWAREIFIESGTFEYVSSHWQTFITGTKELKRLKSGFLLSQIINRFRDKAFSLLPEKLMHLYSGHEITISGILNSLGVFEVF